MIFLAGVHGVGKTTLCKEIENTLNVPCYTASALIERFSDVKMNADKRVESIADNQQILLRAVQCLQSGHEFILEGHLCLLNGEAQVQRIGLKIFTELAPTAIFILIADEKEICRRNHEKSGILEDRSFIRYFQEQEIAFGKELAEKLGIPVREINAENGVSTIAEFLEETKI